MKLLDALAAEHAAFRRLLGRLEAAFCLPERQAARAAGELLATLLPALEGHEDLEHALLEPEDDGLERLVESQRLDLENLREDIALLLERPGGAGLSRLQVMSNLLLAKLEAHFLMEETKIWPALARRGSRSLSVSLARRARLRLSQLEEELACRREGLDALLD